MKLRPTNHAIPTLQMRTSLIIRNEAVAEYIRSVPKGARSYQIEMIILSALQDQSDGGFSIQPPVTIKPSNVPEIDQEIEIAPDPAPALRSMEDVELGQPMTKKQIDSANTLRAAFDVLGGD